jgi:hypothetical protein
MYTHISILILAFSKLSTVYLDNFHTKGKYVFEYVYVHVLVIFHVCGCVYLYVCICVIISDFHEENWKNNVGVQHTYFMSCLL